MGKITWLRALLLAALTVPWSAGAADFGMLGIVTGQTARLTVVNLATGQLPPNPCRVQLSFLDTTGQPVQGDGGPVVTTATLAPGATASLNFRAIANFGTRIMIRPVVRALSPASCAAVSTAELVDNASGSTVVAVPTDPCFALPNEVSAVCRAATGTNFGLRGLVIGQTARLIVVNVSTVQLPPNPCQVELRFVGQDGQTLLGDGGPVVTTATLAPGAAAFLDLRSPLGGGTRTAYRAVVHKLTPSGSESAPRCNLVATGELFDSFSGKTAVAYPTDACIGGACRSFEP